MYNNNILLGYQKSKTVCLSIWLISTFSTHFKYITSYDYNDK